MNFWSQIHFWANLDLKSQSCSFCLIIGTHVIPRLLILVPTLVFWISKANSIFGQCGRKNSNLSSLAENWHTECLTMLILIPTLLFSVSNPNLILDKFGPKKLKLFILTENCHTWYIEDADSYSDTSFLNKLPTLNTFLGKYGLKKSKLFVLPEN